MNLVVHTFNTECNDLMLYNVQIKKLYKTKRYKILFILGENLEILHRENLNKRT